MAILQFCCSRFCVLNTARVWQTGDLQQWGHSVTGGRNPRTKLLRKSTSVPLPHLCWKQQTSISTSNKLLPSVKTPGVVLHWRKKKKQPVCVPLLVNLIIVTPAISLKDELQVFCSGRKSLHNLLSAPGERVSESALPSLALSHTIRPQKRKKKK